MTDEEFNCIAEQAGIKFDAAWGTCYTGNTQLKEFATLVAAAEREKSLRLWMLLDEIDTADDIAKSDDKMYRRICQNYQKKRWDILSEAEVDAAIRARGQE